MMPYENVKKCDDVCIHLDTVPLLDGQTDRSGKTISRSACYARWRGTRNARFKERMTCDHGERSIAQFGDVHQYTRRSFIISDRPLHVEHVVNGVRRRMVASLYATHRQMHDKTFTNGKPHYPRRRRRVEQRAGASLAGAQLPAAAVS